MPYQKNRFIFWILGLCFVGGGAYTAAPPEDPNKIVLELSPTTQNPRNSEGAFLPLKDGRILFAYTRFTGGSGDDAAAEIAALYSTDKGITWSLKPETLVRNDAQANVMSVSLLRLRDGRIVLFYLKKNNLADCRPYLKISWDEAKTWGEPQLALPAPGYFVVNNDRVVQLKSGRLVIPAAFHRLKGPNPGDMKNFDSRAIALYYLSDDTGRLWRESKTWWSLPVASQTGLQEPGIIELKDGRIFSWARTDQGCQYGMYSQDGGETWSAPKPTPFKSPTSPLSMKRIPSKGHLLAIWNDHSGRYNLPEAGRDSWSRTPLASAISRDEGKTWGNFKLIESDPNSGYCYTAIEFLDNFVLLAYCAGDASTKGVLNRLRVRRIKLDWFYQP